MIFKLLILRKPTEHHDAELDEGGGEEAEDHVVLGVGEEDHEGHREADYQEDVGYQEVDHAQRHRPARVRSLISVASLYTIYTRGMLPSTYLRRH